MDILCYCPVCGKEEKYTIKSIKKHFKKDDISFDYIEKIAICNECGEELYVDELNSLNQEEFELTYKQALDIISTDEIREILSKYRITKRNLPYVLGIGEQTITRYLDDGYIPSKKISDLLKLVLNNPEVYFEYLNKNKDKLKDSVYKKSKNQVDYLLKINDNDTLIEDVAEYIIENNDETTNLVLQKLLYYVDLFFGLFNGKKLFKSKCSAWEHGPAYARIYYEYKSFGSDPISNDETSNELNSEIKELVDYIISDFGCYSGKVLSYFTHSEEPWKTGISSEEKIIDEEEMINYAKTIKNKHNINSYEDIQKYSNIKFEEYKRSISNQPTSN